MALSENADTLLPRANGRRKPMQARAHSSRASIINGARRLIAKDGFGALTMRKLAATSDVGLGTIYEYFSGSAEIIRVLLLERFALRQDILRTTMNDVSQEQGLNVFVSAYLRRLTDEGFWSRYDWQLSEAARADPDHSILFEEQEEQLASICVAEMIRAGSQWSEQNLLQVARLNMDVSRMIVASSATRTASATTETTRYDDLQIDLVANMILANLKLILKSPMTSNAHNT